MKIPTEQTFWFILGSGFTTVKGKSKKEHGFFVFVCEYNFALLPLPVPENVVTYARACQDKAVAFAYVHHIIRTKRTAFVNASNDTYNGRGEKMSYENNEATDPYLRYLLVVLVLVLVPDRQRPVRTLSSDVVDQHELQQTGVYAAHAHAVPHVHGRQI